MSLSQLDLNLLLVLDTVLAERSVAGAARRLHVTPSAISNALARLRAALGDPLVTRVGRGIVPTPRAQRLAPALRRALGELEAAVGVEGFDPATTTRQLTVAIADAGQVARLPRLAARLAAEMPRARLRVVGVDTYVSTGGLAGTEVDVGILGLAEAPPGVRLEPLYRERSVLVARRGHPRARGRLTRAALAGLTHVEVEVAPGRGYRELARRYARLGLPREVAVIVPSFTAAAAVVAATDHVATVPASLVDVLGERLGLRALGGPAPTVTTRIRLAWHERTHDDPAMRAFRELVARAVRAEARRATTAPS